jgi:hypothetical protein
MTLGCGGFGGNITSDNITPRHLINVKRVAYELRAASARVPEVPALPEAPRASFQPATSSPRLPQAPVPPAADFIRADVLTSRIDRFLASRGLAQPGTQTSEVLQSSQAPQGSVSPQAAAIQAEKFVCEDDVRLALKEGRKLMIGERTIVTPAARDAGEAAKVFIYAGWPQP